MTNRRLMVSLSTALMALALAGGMEADNLAYLLTGTDQFGTIDLDTGTYQQLGNTGMLLSGLGVAEGGLFGGVFEGSTLYQVTPSNGNLRTVGDSSITYCITGSTTKGLYAIDVNNNLYSVDPATAAVSLIGPVGVPCLGSIEGMSTNSDMLFFTKGSDLYLVSTAKGPETLATLVGDTGTNGIGAMLFEGGKLYAGVTSPFQIDTLNTSTGVGTFVSNPTGNPAPGNFWGLAPSILLNVAPASLKFPRQAVGTTSSPQTMTLANSGFVALKIKRIETSGDFSESSTTCRLTLRAGESCTISITFMPTGTGRLTGTLEVSDSAAGSPQRVLLTGIGEHSLSTMSNTEGVGKAQRTAPHARPLIGMIASPAY